MRAIYKYEILITDDIQTFNLPYTSTIVHFGEQDGKLMMWVDQSTDQKDMPINIRVFGTGHDIGDYQNVFMKTVQMKSGLVWHIFERP